MLHGYHRSGWSYVLDKMKDLHNPNGVIFDSYLDKTFGWEYDFLSISQTIPYQNNWIGVLHHTSDTDYTENNLVNVFEKNNFIDSLVHCRGIIVLSDNNRKWIQTRFDEAGLDIPVIALYHPTELVDKSYQFDYEMFSINPVKKVLHIGAWLRNSYAIYDLKIPKHYMKFALKGKAMGNYFLNDKQFEEIENQLRKIGTGEQERSSGGVCNNNNTHKYVVGWLDLIQSNHHSVTVLQNVSNDEYDELLRSSVVFINLVDASAVNTILECIVRNTPIIVNRLPATEEYLGPSYPLFYNDLDEVSDLLSDVNIRRGYNYFLRMNKTKLTIDYFLNSLVKSELYQSL